MRQAHDAAFALFLCLVAKHWIRRGHLYVRWFEQRSTPDHIRQADPLSGKRAMSPRQGQVACPAGRSRMLWIRAWHTRTGSRAGAVGCQYAVGGAGRTWGVVVL